MELQIKLFLILIVEERDLEQILITQFVKTKYINVLIVEK